MLRALPIVVALVFSGCLPQATKEEGLALLDAVIKDSEAFRKGVHPDDEVRLAGI